MHSKTPVLTVAAAALFASGCILLQPPNKVFQTEQRPPAEATSGPAVEAFRAVEHSIDPLTVEDDDRDPLIPKGGTFLRWYPVSSDWEVGRNDYGVVVERYAQAVFQYRVENKCYWTWQNITQEHMGGGSFGGTKAVVMARTRDIFTFPCSEARAEANE